MKDLNRGIITYSLNFQIHGQARVTYGCIYWPRASVSNMEEQKCERDIERDINEGANNINFSILGKFDTDCPRY